MTDAIADELLEYLCAIGSEETWTIRAETDQARSTCETLYGTSIAAIPRTTSTGKDGSFSVPFSDGPTPQQVRLSLAIFFDLGCMSTDDSCRAVGSVLSYIFYWLAAIAVLVYMKYKEGRTKLLGAESAAAKRRREESAPRLPQ
jgi:hypothetical protein